MCSPSHSMRGLIAWGERERERERERESILFLFSMFVAIIERMSKKVVRFSQILETLSIKLFFGHFYEYWLKSLLFFSLNKKRRNSFQLKSVIHFSSHSFGFGLSFLLDRNPLNQNLLSDIKWDFVSLKLRPNPFSWILNQWMIF